MKRLNTYYLAKHLYRFGIYAAEKERTEDHRPLIKDGFDNRDACIQKAWFKISDRIIKGDFKQ